MDDVIDTRNLIKEMQTLEAEEYRDAVEEARLNAIRKLENEGISEWYDGAQLIREDFFKDYAQQLAEDCGMIPDDVSWPLTCIDWGQAASELIHDYSLVEFDGESYYVRS